MHCNGTWIVTEGQSCESQTVMIILWSLLDSATLSGVGVSPKEMKLFGVPFSIR